ncbi:MAG: S-layer family protein [Lyngbya sp.]|nr:S-layer family protein [Lyngbya sp.]
MLPRSLAFPTLATLTSLWCAVPLTATAQIVPDNTLGNENSVVVPNQNIRGINSDRIDGGAVRGGNLFHSFEEFNIDEGRGAYFSNPDNIINILTRVTGGNISQILGTLGVLGNANLFLINPNGIVFGPNARLDVGGSFFASTADGILFENGFEFAASNPEAPPLLTINMPLGLNIRENPGTIVNQTLSPFVDSEGEIPDGIPLGLYVPPEETIALIGGEVRLEGGLIKSPGSQIELGGLSDAGAVELNLESSNSKLDFPDNVNRADIVLTESAEVNVRSGDGGSIFVNARDFQMLNNSKLLAGIEESQGSIGSQAGDININSSGLVQLSGASKITNLVQERGNGNSGNVNITAENLRILEGSEISSFTSGLGNGGLVSVQATNSIELDNSVIYGGTNPTAIGQGGRVQVTANSLTVREGAEINTSTLGQGDAGALTLNTQRLSVRDGTQIVTGTFGNGDGGNLTVTATDVELVDSLLGASVQPGATGNGGTLTINTQNLSVRDGAQISASTFGNGDGGNLTVTATDVELVGSRSLLAASVQPGATGNGGTLTINTQNLSVRDGAQILTATSGNGDGGNLTVTANDVELVGRSADGQFPSGFFATVEQGATGKGGTLTIDTQRLSVRDGAQIGIGTFGNGDAGNLTITANDVQVVGRSADGQFPSGFFATVEQGATGKGGTLTIDTQRLSVRDGAQISTSTSGNGDGGNLIITATDVELVGTTADGFSSGLFASAERESIGRAGTLTVNAENLTVRDGATIDVRSETSEPAGNLVINAPFILLDNQASLNADTTAGQGNIIVNTNDLTLRRNSNITTNATGEATGGNIVLNANTLVAIENSDISANAQAAFGGQVIINADAIFGTQFRQQPTGASDITATSELGADFSGTVDLNTEIDPSSGLIELPQSVVDPAALIAQDPCKQRGSSEFVITGRGGIAPNPVQDSSTIPRLVELQSPLIEPVISQSNNSSQRPQQHSQKRDNNLDDYPVDSRTIVPARGWIRTEDGQIILVGYDPTKTGVQRQPNNPRTCQP